MIRDLGARAIVAMAAAATSTMQPLQGPGPGVPLSLAEERARRISDLGTSCASPSPRKAAPITGHVTIRFTLEDASRPLALDFSPPKRPATRPANAAAIALSGAPIT